MRLTTYNLILEGEERTPCLVRESAKNYPQFSKITTSSEGVKVINAIFNANKQAEEHCYMIAFRSSRVIGVFEISHGIVNSSLITPKELMTRLLLLSATSFLFFHNHPSGDITPSVSDKKVTKNLRDAGEMMGIPLLDHIIIGENDKDHYSFFSDSDMFKNK